MRSWFCKHRTLWTGATDFCGCLRSHYFCDDCGKRTDHCPIAPRTRLARVVDEGQYVWWWALNRADNLTFWMKGRWRRDH